MSLKVKRNQYRVNIIIPEYRIEGTIHLNPMTRISDFVNTSPEFIPVTEAKIFSVYENKLIQEIKLMVVQRSQIILLYPLEAHAEVEKKENFLEQSLESVHLDFTWNK